MSTPHAAHTTLQQACVGDNEGSSECDRFQYVHSPEWWVSQEGKKFFLFEWRVSINF
jgi:hypothetical protein